MAFCSKCGKSLAEGEVCSCQQAEGQQPQQTAVAAPPAPQQQQVSPASSAPQPIPHPAGTFFAGLLGAVRQYVKSPVDEMKRQYEKGEALHGGVVAGVGALLSGFTAMALAGIYARALSPFGSLGSSLGIYIGPHLFSMFITFFFFGAAMYFATCGLAVLAGAAAKKKVSFFGVMAAAGMNCLPTSAICLLAILFSFFAPALSIGLLMINLVVWAVSSYELAKVTLGAQGGKTPLVYGAGLGLTFAIIFSIFLSIAW